MIGTWKKLNKVGRFVVVIVVGTTLAAILLLAQYVWGSARSWESMSDDLEFASPTRVAAAATSTRESSLPASLEPTLAPLPEGWRVEHDPFGGDEYLAPPPEVEVAVREAFDAVLSLEVISDRSNEEALLYDPGAALARAETMATADVVERYTHLDFVELGAMGPENPVQCQDYDTCEAVQVKMGVGAYVLYNPDMCANLDAGIPAEHKGPNGNFLLAGDGTHCVNRFVEDDNPYAVYFATVELRGAQWIVTSLEWDTIPEPNRQ